MKDITELFKKVTSSELNWSVSVFYSVLEYIKKQKFQVSFWEGEENWASIIYNNNTVGYIWKKYPLIIFEEQIYPFLDQYFKDIDGVYYLNVDSLNIDLFSIQREEFKDYFENFHKFDSFTIEDLWFFTN